jgi:hypothetical protein
MAWVTFGNGVFVYGFGIMYEKEVLREERVLV